ncbi:MAG: FtsX-like permease family protein [Gemmatales bacterium]
MMTRLTFPIRNLSYFFTANVLLIVGVAIGTAVLTGALLLGDSLKGSLKQLTLDRLGHIESALIADRFFSVGLAEQSNGKNAPVIVMRGTVLRRSADGSQLLNRAGRVQIVGVDSRFWPLFDCEYSNWQDGYIINQALADALEFKSGETLEVRMEKPDSIPSDSVLGQRSEQAMVLESANVVNILPNVGPGRFTLQPMQSEPLILYVKLQTLWRRMPEGQQAHVNVLLSSTSDDWQQVTNRLFNLTDIGYRTRINEKKNVLSLTCQRLILEPRVVEAVQKSLASSNYVATPTLTYLANRIFKLENGQPSQKFIPYSTIVGTMMLNQKPIAEDEAVVNEFVADEFERNLKNIRIEYFVETEGHRLVEKQYDLKVNRWGIQSDETTDRTWTPDFPGMKATLAEWDPPFPREQWHREWIRKRDEDYYKQLGATPKLFVHPNTAKKLFASRYGDATSIRIQKKDGTPLTAPEQKELESKVMKVMGPSDFGLVWQNLREQGLKSAVQGGTTNMFGGLFAGFSLFLIVAAALLVALLFRLRLEKRAKEIGLLLATGWSVPLLRRTLLTEGMFLAILGALFGIPLALGYAWLMIAGLRSGWGGLLASNSLSLHYTPVTLAVGATISVMIALLSMFLSLRSLVKLPAPQLLAGRTEPTLAFGSRSRLWIRWLPVVFIMLALVLLGFGMTLPLAQQPGSFFGAGFLILFAGILLVRQYLRNRTGRSLTAHSTLWDLGKLNVSRSPSRSLATIALLASGCFLVVAVGAFRKGAVDVASKTSGTGGYSLLAESDVPLRVVPRSDAEWKAVLGDRYEDVKSHLAGVRDLNWVGLRLRSGDDVSCLNLYQPTKPRVLGASSAFTDRGGFDVTLATRSSEANPWKFLASSRELNLYLDDHTAQWVMQKQPGDKVTLTDELDQPREALFAAMINGSIFQSELLLSEANFRNLYPSEAGYRYFLIDVPADKLAGVRSSLELLLGESHGLFVQSTASKLAAFHAVENTYIGTFQALGGLGLLLGTAGLALVILRNVQERQSELALLQAIGFTRQQLARTILSEVVWIVLFGIAIGSIAALCVIGPLMATGSVGQLFLWLGLVLLLVPVVAMLASLAGVSLALRTPLIPALRGE